MDVVIALFAAALCFALAIVTLAVDVAKLVRRKRTEWWTGLVSLASTVGAFYCVFAIADGEITQHRERMAATVCATHRGFSGVFAGSADRGNLPVLGAGRRHLWFYCRDNAEVEVVRDSLDRFQTVAVTSHGAAP